MVEFSTKTASIRLCSAVKAIGFGVNAVLEVKSEKQESSHK